MGRMLFRTIDYLKNINVLHNIDDHSIHKLALSCEHIYRSINYVLFKEGEIIDYTYFILQGEVKISHTLKTPKPQKSLKLIEIQNKLNEEEEESLSDDDE